MSKLGSTVLWRDTLPSTNDLAREMALGGAAEGLAVVARAQTAGRGRQGRTWASSANEGLYLSLILRPDIGPMDAPVITLAAAVGLAETLHEEYNLAPDIKWPNDVMVNGRKISGILLESATEGQSLQYLILGIGVNLVQVEFPPELSGTATSLLLESGSRVPPDAFLPPLLEALERWYRIAIAHPQEVIERWQALSSYAHNCRVRVTAADEVVEGTTRGLTSRGGLILEMETGQTCEIISGEVSLRKDPDAT